MQIVFTDFYIIYKKRNQKVQMRKYKNNIRQQVFRGYQTPSPTNFTDLKSPRFGQIVNKKTDFNTQASKQYSSTQQFNIFKTQVKLVKERQNVLSTQNQQHKNKKLKKLQNEQIIKKHLSQSQLNPYSFYLQPEQTQVEQKKVSSNNNIVRGYSRKTSTSREQSAQGHNSKNSFQETIRKLANQNIRLRHQFKILSEKNEKYSIEKKNIAQQNNILKFQIQKLLKLNQQIQRKQNSMMEQIKNLKKMLNLSSQQLSSSNYEIFKLKQQVSQIKQVNQKLQSKTIQKIQKKKLLSFKSQKTIYPEVQSENLKKSIPCKNCKVLNLSITDLIFLNQNLKLQLGQKNVLINTLCSEIHKIEGQLKLLEKPKNLQKKYNNIITDLNQQIISQKAKDLSYKYMKITK